MAKTSDDCVTCGKPATPHCASKHCAWLTCTDAECATTWHPKRPEITLRPQR